MLIKSPPPALVGLLQDDLRPRLTNLPRGRFSSATALEALEWLSYVGYTLDPWQNYITALSLLETTGATPEWYSRAFAYLISRQNGKGGILTARTLIDTFFLHQPVALRGKWAEPHLVVYTAHQFKTASEAYERVKRVIEASPDLRKMMVQNRNLGMRSNALDKGFDLQAGNRVRYLARATSGGSGRGWSIPTLLIDEAQELPDEAVKALFDTQSAMRNPQRLMTGTVPGPRENSGEWTRTRDRGRTGSDRMAWLEYSVDPEIAQAWPPDAVFGEHIDPNLRLARSVNPAIGYRLNLGMIEESLGRRARDYAQERLSYWPNESARGILPNWANLHDSESSIVGPVAFSAEIADDRTSGTIIASGVRVDGLIHLEVVDYRPGTAWMAERLKDLYDAWGPQVICLDVAGPAGTLGPELEALDVPYRPLTALEFGQACSGLFDLVGQSAVRWLGHGSALATAIQYATWRIMGQGRAFDRRVVMPGEAGGDVDMSPLVGCAIGAWAISTGAVPNVEVKGPKQPVVSRTMYGFR